MESRSRSDGCHERLAEGFRTAAHDIVLTLRPLLPLFPASSPRPRPLRSHGLLLGSVGVVQDLRVAVAERTRRGPSMRCESVSAYVSKDWRNNQSLRFLSRRSCRRSEGLYITSRKMHLPFSVTFFRPWPPARLRPPPTCCSRSYYDHDCCRPEVQRRGDSLAARAAGEAQKNAHPMGTALHLACSAVG